MTQLPSLMTETPEESYSGFVISTSHISLEDSQRLNELGEKSDYVMQREHGWVLIIPGDHSLVSNIYGEDFGVTVQSLVTWALCRGVRYLELDSDGQVLPFLTEYNWEVQE